MTIIDICIVNVTRSQKPAPNHCAVCTNELPVASAATKTTATAASARANASGNQRSNQSETRRPMLASVDETGTSGVWLRSLCIYGTLRQPSFLRNTYELFLSLGRAVFTRQIY